jgi:hypothetical protein
MKGLIFFNQEVNRIYGENLRYARALLMFRCPATPAPTPPVSSDDSWSTGVGAGLLYSGTTIGAGVRSEGEVMMKREVKIKEEDKVKVESQSQKQSQNKHRENPPVLSLLGQNLIAGFSTPFPEGLIPFGSLFFNFQAGRLKP